MAPLLVGLLVVGAAISIRFGRGRGYSRPQAAKRFGLTVVGLIVAYFLLALLVLGIWSLFGSAPDL